MKVTEHTFTFNVGDTVKTATYQAKEATFKITRMRVEQGSLLRHEDVFLVFDKSKKYKSGHPWGWTDARVCSLVESVEEWNFGVY